MLWACIAPLGARAQNVEANTAIYVREDTDYTTVITPRVHVGSQATEATRLDLVYTVDVWSSASIDIRTAATPSAVDAKRRVTEQRDEIDLSLEHALGDVTLGASYRYSTEHDYESHGGSLTGVIDMAGKAANLALSARAFFDRVGQAGNPNFDEGATTLIGRAAFTQVIDPQMFVQAIYEATHQQGFLSSPYRRVRVSEDGSMPPLSCRGTGARYCLSENNPESRMRHAIAINGRRALTSALSVGLGYRFYLDDWELMSHTASLDGALALGEDWFLSLAYRFYLQGTAVHYKPYYLRAALPRFYTSDKELSAMTSHRVDLELSRTFEIDDLGSALRLVLLAAPSMFSYSEFPLLSQVKAIELSLAVEARL